MGYMTKQEYEEKLHKIRLKNQQKRRKQQLKDEKKKYKKKKKLPPTSKLILIGAVILSLQIILFCEYMMWKTGDLIALCALVGIAASLTLVVTSYNKKACAENTAGGIVYETAMQNLKQLAQTACGDMAPIIEDDNISE